MFKKNNFKNDKQHILSSYSLRIVKLLSIYCLLIIIFIPSCKYLDENNFNTNINRAINFKANENYTDALKSINKALAIDSSKSNAYVLKGQIEGTLEADSLSLISFTRAIYLNPKNISAYFYKALTFSILNASDSAIKNFNKAISLKQIPGQAYFEEINNKHLPFEDQVDVPVYMIKYFRGLSLIDLGKYKEALEDFQYSLSNQYNVYNSQYYIGAAYAKLGNKDEACFYLKQARDGGNVDAEKIIRDYCK